MTWHWLICFSAALPLLPATVEGQVELVDSRQANVQKKKDFSGVLIWLEPVGRDAELPASKKFTLRQKGKRFSPHILTIPVGAAVDFPNFDPIFHNAFSNFAGQPFDTGLYPPGDNREVVFRRAGIVRVFCNIHSNMSAVIAVMNTPYYSLTDTAGRFRIDGVAPGDYRMRVWHERAPETTLKALERRLTVSDSGATAPPIRISESGYLEIPHKNKHGKEYPPTPPEHIVYPGGRK
jgi:plastocyanin